jgi:hypothetical protein
VDSALKALDTGCDVVRPYGLCPTLRLVSDGMTLRLLYGSDEASQTVCLTCNGVAHQRALPLSSGLDRTGCAASSTLPASFEPRDIPRSPPCMGSRHVYDRRWGFSIHVHYNGLCPPCLASAGQGLCMCVEDQWVGDDHLGRYFDYLCTHGLWLPSLVEAGRDSAGMLRRSGFSGDGSRQTGRPVSRLYGLFPTLRLVRDGMTLRLLYGSDEASQTVCLTCNGVAHQRALPLSSGLDRTGCAASSTLPACLELRDILISPRWVDADGVHYTRALQGPLPIMSGLS